MSFTKYIILIAVLLSAVLLNSQVVVLVEKTSNSQLNQIERLQLNLVLDMKEYLLLSVTSTDILTSNKIDFQVLTENHETDPLVVIASDNNQPLSRSSYVGEIVLNKHDLRLEKLRNSSEFLTREANIKIIPLRIFNNPYKNKKITRQFSQNVLLKDEITPILNSVHADSVAWYIQKLEDFETRFAFHDNRRDVSVWIANQFKRFGYENVVLDSFFMRTNLGETWQYNVVAVEEGELFPDQYVIIGGHHDSINQNGSNDITNVFETSMIFAPGADDNASGVASVLEIARIIKLHDFKPKSTIRFITFAMEELGLFGAYYDAGKLRAANANVLAMVNSDMIGYPPEVGDYIYAIRNYPNSDFLTEKARDFGEELDMIMWTNDDMIDRSDSWAYFQAGYHAVFFAEPFLTPHYHTSLDILENMDTDYAAQFIRLNTKLSLTLSGMPTPPENFIVLNTGVGSLLAKWDGFDHDNAYFVITTKNTETGAESTHNTHQTELTISNLSLNAEYEITLYGFIDDVSSFGQVRFITPRIEPAMVEDFTHKSEKRKINFNWAKNTELDINGYKIFRRILNTGEFVEITNLDKNQTSWTDQTTADNTWYEYQIFAFDTDGHQSIESQTLRARHISHCSGILVMGFGATSPYEPFEPSKESVDAFYKELIGNYKHEILGNFNIRGMNAESIGIYSTLIIHNNLFHRGINNDLPDLVKEFIDTGGNVFISTNDPIFSLGGFTGNYPRNFTEGDYAFDYFGVTSVRENYYSYFSKGISTGWKNLPDLEIDPEKSTEDFYYKIFDVEGITGEYQEIYTYSSGNSPENQTNLDGMTVVFYTKKGDSKIFVSSIPLYSIKKDQAKLFMQAVLAELGETVSEVDVVTPPIISLNLKNYPNPFNPTTIIQFGIRSAELGINLTHVSVDIYNIKGQKVKSLVNGVFPAGEHTVVWNGTDDKGIPQASGVYLYQVKTGCGLIESKKMVMIK